MKLRGIAFPLRVIVTFGFVALSSNLVSAHCDGMDGPVVIAAQKFVRTVPFAKTQ